MSLISLQYGNTFADQFKDLKIRQKVRYLVCKIEDEKMLHIEQTGPKMATFQELLNSLPKDEPRYVVFDFPLTERISKLIFIFWSPAVSSIRNKMIYSAAKESVKKNLSGCQREFQAGECNELDEEEIRKILL